jgi:hypothetical protein
MRMNFGALMNIAKNITCATKEDLKKRIEEISIEQSNSIAPSIDVVLELGMISQRLLELSKEAIKRQFEEDIERQNVPWNKIPKGDDPKYWLDTFGRREWTRQFPEGKHSANRSYHWVDRIIILDANRKVLEDMVLFSDFIKASDYKQWTPVQPEITEHEGDDKPSL